MARPHIEFIEAFDVESEELTAGPLVGSSRRLLSADDEGGDFTALFTFPEGWSGDVASSRPVELFGLRGALELDGQGLGPGCYAYVPSGSSRGLLRARDCAQALVMVERERAAEPDGPIEVIDQATRRWHQPGPPNPDRPQGIVIKLLREDPESGDWTWVAGLVPGWLKTTAERHPTVEEALMLRGDILQGERGAMHAGSYLWRPAMVRHGPGFTRDGAVFFVRSKGGSLSTTWEELPGWERIVDEYVAQAPFFAGPDGQTANSP